MKTKTLIINTTLTHLQLTLSSTWYTKFPRTATIVGNQLASAITVSWIIHMFCTIENIVRASELISNVKRILLINNLNYFPSTLFILLFKWNSWFPVRDAFSELWLVKGNNPYGLYTSYPRINFIMLIKEFMCNIK